MTLFLLIAVVLASQAIVQVWLQGEIFAPARARIEAEGGWLAELAGCSYCLLFWTPCLLLMLCWVPSQLISLLALRTDPVSAAIGADILRLPIYALAATRLATFTSQLSPGITRLIQKLQAAVAK
jgi:hypothetical protein